MSSISSPDPNHVPAEFNVGIGSRGSIDVDKQTTQRVYDVFIEFKELVLSHVNDKNAFTANTRGELTSDNASIEINIYTKQVVIYRRDAAPGEAPETLDLASLPGLGKTDSIAANRLLLQKAEDMQNILANKDYIATFKTSVLGRDYSSEHAYSLAAVVGDNAFKSALSHLKGHDNTIAKLSEEIGTIRADIISHLCPGCDAKEIEDFEDEIATRYEYVESVLKDLKANVEEMIEVLTEEIDDAKQNDDLISQEELENDLKILEKKKAELELSTPEKCLLYLSTVIRVLSHRVESIEGPIQEFSDNASRVLEQIFKDHEIGREYGVRPEPKGLIGKLKSLFQKDTPITVRTQKQHKDICNLVVGAGVFSKSDDLADDDYHHTNRIEKYAYGKFMARHHVDLKHLGTIGTLMRLQEDNQKDVFEKNLRALLHMSGDIATAGMQDELYNRIDEISSFCQVEDHEQFESDRGTSAEVRASGIRSISSVEDELSSDDDSEDDDEISI
ncbi:MAG: hypothetical protein S4CHLAM20_07500 [Chlamydiia bacterium]|nr:hypothetical protein [Chlamydiia bacterium]